MIKNLIASITLLFSFGMAVQTGTASPYSFYGIGDVTFKGALENRSMGGVSVFSDSIHINLQNPASFAGLRQTAFTVAITNNSTNLVTNTAESKATRTPLDHLAIGLPMGRFGVGVGLMPYSSVGYKLQSVSGDPQHTRRFEGSGGVNKAFLAVGYKLNSKFNVGVDLQYNFGEITTKSLERVTGIQYATQEVNVSDLSGLTVNAAVMYQTRLKNNIDLFASVVVSPETNLKSSNDRSIYTGYYTVDKIYSQDTLIVDAANTTLKMPAKIAFGGGIGVVRHWLIGTEVTLRQSGNLGSRFNDINNVSYQNSEVYSLGGYYIPNYNSFRSYLARVTYRGGLRYEKTGLVIQGKSIEDKALTLGFGFPLTGTFSNLNIGVEFGRRGTEAAGLVEENYRNISLSLSLNDKWFVRNKYN